MLKFITTSQRNNVENIGYRTSYVSGEIAEVQSTEGKYKVKIAGTDDEYPHIWSIQTNPDYVVGERVGVLWEYGNREKPVLAGVLRNTTYIEVTSSVNSLGV